MRRGCTKIVRRIRAACFRYRWPAAKLHADDTERPKNTIGFGAGMSYGGKTDNKSGSVNTVTNNDLNSFWRSQWSIRIARNIDLIERC